MEPTVEKLLSVRVIGKANLETSIVEINTTGGFLRLTKEDLSTIMLEVTLACRDEHIKELNLTAQSIREQIM